MAVKKTNNVKAIVFQQAMFVGIGVEAVISFKVVAHYVTALWGGVLALPTTVMHQASGLIEQIAHAFGA